MNKFRYEPLADNEVITEKKFTFLIDPTSSELSNSGNVIEVYVIATTSCEKFAIVRDVRDHTSFIAERKDFRKRLQLTEQTELDFLKFNFCDINLDNYDHEEVSRLNNWAIRAIEYLDKLPTCDQATN